MKNDAGLTPINVALAKGYANIQTILRLAGATLETEAELIGYVESQLWLRAYGIVRPDDQLDGDTRATISTYQRDAGIIADGRVTKSLADHLDSAGHYRVVLTDGNTVTTNVFVDYRRLEAEFGLTDLPLRVSGASVSYRPTANRVTNCSVPRGYASAAQCLSANDHRLGDLTINGRIILLQTGVVLMKGCEVSLAPR